MNQKVNIEIRKRKLIVEMEGLTPLEINSLAAEVANRIDEIEEVNHIADSSKLGILAALEYAAEVHRLQNAHADASRVVEHKLDQINLSIQGALAKEDQRR